MGGEWEYKPIDDVAEKVSMGPFGSSIKVSTFVTEGVPIISGQHLNETQVQDGENNFITHAHAEQLRNANVFRGDVIFTHAGNIGQVAYIPKNSRYERYVISQRQFYMRCNTSKILPEFVVYYFKSPQGQHRLLANSTPSGVPSIAQPVTYLRSIEIPVPTILEQQRVVQTLASIDNKIEANRKINKMLEEIARAIFKHWFIDFEFPNENGDPYKSSGGEMIDSPLGPIPKGWSTSKFSDTISVNPSRGLKKGVCAKKVRMTDIEPWRSYVGSYTEGIYKSGPKFQNGDVLLARITPSLENGKTAFVSFLKDGEVAYGSTEFIVFAPRVIKSSAYIYCLVRSDSFRDYAIGSMNGSSGRQRVPNDCLDALEIALPAHNLINEFEKTAKTLFSKIDCKGKENVLLSELRDSLLPKLMSGEIRVPVSEKEVDQF